MKTMEQSDTLTNVNLLDKLESSNELKFKHIENTPFTIVQQNKEFYGIIGSHRITESYLSEEICEESLKEITWDRITQVIWAISNKMENINKLKNLENE